MRHVPSSKAELSADFVMGRWRLTWAGLLIAFWTKPVWACVSQRRFVPLRYALSPLAMHTIAAHSALTSCIGALFGIVLGSVWNAPVAGKLETGHLARLQLRSNGPVISR